MGGFLGSHHKDNLHEAETPYLTFKNGFLEYMVLIRAWNFKCPLQIIPPPAAALDTTYFSIPPPTKGSLEPDWCKVDWS